MKEEKTLRQNLDEKGKFQRLYQMYLLFREQGTRPETATMLEKLKQEFGKVDLVADAEGSLATFALHRYPVQYKDKNSVPAQILMTGFAPFEPESVDPMQRSQWWDCPDGGALLDSCKYQVMLSDFLASGLDYKLRCRMLATWLELALTWFPGCIAVWIPASGKLLTPAQILNNPYRGDNRFVYFGVNVRFFNIEGSADSLIDSLGLYAVGLPDVQYHFHSLDPDAMANHAYGVASYIFENRAPVKEEETIAGIGTDGQTDPEVKWVCRYEWSLLQPEREVMDICPGEYAAGHREE